MGEFCSENKEGVSHTVEDDSGTLSGSKWVGTIQNGTYPQVNLGINKIRDGAMVPIQSTPKMTSKIRISSAIWLFSSLSIN